MLNLSVKFLPPDSEREVWVVYCPEIDVYTQGDTYEEAAENIRDAVQCWFDFCIEHGTLEKVLTECGFSPVRIERMKNAYSVAYSHENVSQRCHA